MARGGFSGAPVLVAYDEQNEDGGTAALGLVTESLSENDKALTNKDLATSSPVVDRNTDSINQNIAQSQAKIDTSELPAELAEIV